ncbi:MAG TPA: hypothetical protein EYO25_01795 [Candidatus Thioglobus sp.]|jgi:hypothetical protein|nr:hypothetical protein [Candidatus Thioglobus sp.]
MIKLLTTTVISLLLSLQTLAASDYSLQEKLACAADSMYIYNFPLAMARSAPGQEQEVQYIQSIQLTWYTTILNNLIETEKTIDEAKKIIKAEIDKSTTKIDNILKDANRKNFNELFETKVLPIQIECNRKFIEKSE